MIRPTRKKTLVSVSVHNIDKAKKAIKDQLPVLTPAEIRRYRIPYSETTVLELQEAGCKEAAEYFRFLFDLDEEARVTAGPNTVIWNKPKLIDNNELIDRLREVLVEFFQKSSPIEKRVSRMVELSRHIESLSWEWWWIADTLYRSSIYVAKEIEQRDNQLVTLLRYVYARFLFYRMEDATGALEYVRQAQRDSLDKPWNASKLLGGAKQDCLYRESCRLAHKILLVVGKRLRGCDDNAAVDSCKLALSSACQSGNDELIGEAHYELGKSDFAAGNTKEALKHFLKSLRIMRKISDPEGICRVHSKLVWVYKEMGEDREVLKHLREFKETASEFQLSHKLAEVHYLTGEYYLAKDDPKKATPNLERAFALYNQLGARDEATRARCLTGVSRGNLCVNARQEMMEGYRTLIMQSVKGDVKATLKICRWKDIGEPFDEILMHTEDLREALLIDFFVRYKLMDIFEFMRCFFQWALTTAQYIKNTIIIVIIQTYLVLVNVDSITMNDYMMVIAE